MRLQIAPYPIYGPLISKLIDNDEVVTLKLARNKLFGEDKRQLLTELDLVTIRELSEEIQQAILNQKTVEQIDQLTRRIEQLEFDFPPQYVEKLRELLKDLLNVSFQ